MSYQATDTAQTPHPVGWGPRACAGAVSLTFDNLGEAARIRRGDSVPADAFGRDPTADFVPQLIEILGELPSTYFIEASNTEIYPLQIGMWLQAGKEVGMHAWQHEHWGKLSPEERVSNLKRCQRGFEAIGVRPRGFRPPGGALPACALAEFARAGLDYCSPLGRAGASEAPAGGIAVLPFAWPHVDAYMLDTTLGYFRQSLGDRQEPFTLEQWSASIAAALELARNERRHVTVIFHPYILLQDERRVRALQDFVHTLRADKDLWVASCGEVVDWMRSSRKAV